MLDWETHDFVSQQIKQRENKLIHQSSDSTGLNSPALRHSFLPLPDKNIRFFQNNTWNTRFYSGATLFLRFLWVTVCYKKNLSKHTANNCVKICIYIHIITLILIPHVWVLFNYFFHFSAIFAREDFDYPKYVCCVWGPFSMFHPLTPQLCLLTVKAGVTVVAQRTFLQIPHPPWEGLESLILSFSKSKGTTWKGRLERVRSWGKGRPHNEKTAHIPDQVINSFVRKFHHPEIQRWNDCGASVSGFSSITSTSLNITEKRNFLSWDMPSFGVLFYHISL